VSARRPSLDHWTDITLRRALRILEDVETTAGYGRTKDGPTVESVRGEIRDLLKARRARTIRNRKLGLHGD
jgi:hypothetical protein